MKKCRYCGKEAAPEFKFCPHCGGELTEDGGADIFVLQKPQPGDVILYRSWEELSAVAGEDPAKIGRLKPVAAGGEISGSGTGGTSGAGSDSSSEGGRNGETGNTGTGSDSDAEPKKGIVSVNDAFPGDNVVVGGVPWKVLWVRGKRKLLLAQQSVALKAFSESGAASWEGSSLRRWLNKQYLETCFSKEEQAKILPTEYLTRISEQGSRPSVRSLRKRPERSTDRVSILSCKEINFYTSELSEESRKTFFSYEKAGLVRDVYLDKNGNGSVSVLRRAERGADWTYADVRAVSNVYPVIWYCTETAEGIF